MSRGEDAVKSALWPSFVLCGIVSASAGAQTLVGALAIAERQGARTKAEYGSRGGSGCTDRVWRCNGHVVEKRLGFDPSARREIKEVLQVMEALQPSGVRTAQQRDAAAVSTTEQQAAPVTPKVELVFWQSIANSTNPVEFEAYLSRFPNGVFRSLAEVRLAALQSAANDPTAPSVRASGGAGSPTSGLQVSGAAGGTFGSAAGVDAVAVDAVMADEVAVPAVPSGSSAAVLQQETVFWDSIRDSVNAAHFEAYLRQFPAGTYRALAAHRLAALRAAGAAAATTTSISDPASPNPRGPVVFMFGDRQRLHSQCPRLPLTTDLRQANLLLFDHPYGLEFRDARGAHVRSYFAVRQGNRAKDMCEDWGRFPAWNGPIVKGLSDTAEDTPPLTDPEVPVAFLAGPFSNNDRQAFTGRCSPIRFTRILDRADLIIVYYLETVRTHVSMYRPDGSLLRSTAPLRRGNVFKDLCETIRSR